VVLVLVGVQNVRAVLVEKAGNAGDQSFAVGTIDEKNGGVFHAISD
jgi:hypothetical protein